MQFLISGESPDTRGVSFPAYCTGFACRNEVVLRENGQRGASGFPSRAEKADNNRFKNCQFWN